MIAVAEVNFLISINSSINNIGSHEEGFCNLFFINFHYLNLIYFLFLLNKSNIFCFASNSFFPIKILSFFIIISIELLEAYS